MALRVKSSHIIALCITVGIAGWMATGTLYVGGEAKAGEEAPAIATREAERSSDLFKVRFVPVVAQERPETIIVRGRTSADARITIRTETSGIVEKRLVAKGDRVEAGQLVCEIDKATRQESVAQAEALLTQARADYEANASLQEKGYASSNKVNQVLASLNSAKASLAKAKWELEHTEVRANASGIVVEPIAEVGDMLNVAGTCVTLLDTNPMLFIGQISERDIGRVSIGTKAQVTLITGEKLNGTIRYIAPAADAATRTFQTEIALEDSKYKVREGMTARAVIQLPSSVAYRISPSWITLDDEGRLGLRTVDAGDKVKFVPIHIVFQGTDGLWVKGPEPGMRVITLGQEYVAAGEKVIPLPDPTVEAALKKARSGD
ncbi:MAG: efflux RND transporter periplasmic adaptor subunit [Salaquimonas sp.]|jgi:multidrug efflux system membrane fusion protein|nr:efflux RND transporter periplasmic adaptor subunit [Salaquimonas sp.]